MLPFEAVDAELLNALDVATGGVIEAFRVYCCQRGYVAHLGVVTPLDTGEDGGMQLYLQALDGSRTMLYASASLSAPAEILGWRLYLEERVFSARLHLARAQEVLGRG